MTSADYLRGYTAPRALLVGLLFLLAVACRVPAVALAVACHVLDRCADRLLTVTTRIPTAPVSVVTSTGRAAR
ncbi:hypothetical protein [Haloactinomyces albus]|uniref:Uncharacterized protein n=1 Tax=Haloactinomyces albus TaxID=1352928 RepID=A0AAE4CPC1_9ACTN|nr:hypothetical protein [Haloactinomyces albus]MDR7301829.1 hypothetical protein [Haloactinomyces albus]MDR7304734.1 hypothetical protein [Haloactinomyces albus]